MPDESRSESLLDPRALRRLSSLELVARRIVEGTMSGHHHSPVRGFSTDFLQHRPYVQGDDVRNLDWKVFGKTDRHFVRQFEDDTQLRATLILDASGSMDYGSTEITKLHYAVRLAAALAFVLVAQHDAIGLEVFDTRPRLRVPPSAGHRHLQAVLAELGAVRAGGETSLAASLEEIIRRAPRRGLLLLITDGLDEPDSLAASLRQLGQREQEVILFQVSDRQEIEFRFHHWTRFEDLEQPGEEILVDPAQLRAEYLERRERLDAALAQASEDARIELVRVVTDRPYDAALAEYLRRRRSGA